MSRRFLGCTHQRGAGDITEITENIKSGCLGEKKIAPRRPTAGGFFNYTRAKEHSNHNILQPARHQTTRLLLAQECIFNKLELFGSAEGLEVPFGLAVGSAAGQRTPARGCKLGEGFVLLQAGLTLCRDKFWGRSGNLTAAGEAQNVAGCGQRQPRAGFVLVVSMEIVVPAASWSPMWLGAPAGSSSPAARVCATARRNPSLGVWGKKWKEQVRKSCHNAVAMQLPGHACLLDSSSLQTLQKLFL